jgi:hypothetical protein
MSSARRPPSRQLPDLGDLPAHGRQIVYALILRNRRTLRQNGTVIGDGDWLNGFLEGLYAADGLTSRAEVTRVARLIQDDVVNSLAALHS